MVVESRCASRATGGVINQPDIVSMVCCSPTRHHDRPPPVCCPPPVTMTDLLQSVVPHFCCR